MRVLLVNDYPPGSTGGVEIHLSRVARGLEEAGDEVAMFAGVVRHSGLRKILDVWDPTARRLLAERIAEFDPDVVHFHNVQRELSPAVLTVRPRRPTVLTINDHRLFDAQDGSIRLRRTPLVRAKQMKSALERALVRRNIDVVVAVSADLAIRARAARLGTVEVITNFADDVHAAPTPIGDDVVYAGRLAEEKGIDVLLWAFAEVAADYPDTVFRIAGSGPEEMSLRALAAALLGEQVIFEGLLDEAQVRALMAGARVVCSPSTRRTEGAPLVAVEAMLAARPVIATDSPAYRELLDDEVEGLIVPLDDTAALARALDRLLADRSLATSLGSAARQRAARAYTTSHAVARLREVYERARATRVDLGR